MNATETIAPVGRRPARFARRSRRTAAVVGGSIVAHTLVLGLLAVQRGAVFAPAPADDVILITIEPRPLLDGEAPRRPTPSRRAGEAATTPLRQIVVGRRAPPGAEALDPALTNPLEAAPPGQTTGFDPLWQVRPDTESDRIARAMRAAGVGCHPANRELTAAEQASCDRRLADAARGAAPARGTGDAERDAAFRAQGARELARYEAQRAPLSGGVGVTGPADCVGSNLGMGCAGAHLPPVPGVDMRQGADNLIRQPSNKVD